MSCTRLCVPVCELFAPACCLLAQVVRLLPPLFDACERHDIPATFFELTTLAAFAHFARGPRPVDAAVIEVGLGYLLSCSVPTVFAVWDCGPMLTHADACVVPLSCVGDHACRGRLDATNVIHPAVSVITSIGESAIAVCFAVVWRGCF